MSDKIIFRKALFADDELNAKALNLGDRSVTFPSYNQAVILAGGSASGKGFVCENVLGIRGKVFDVDAIKTKLLRLYQNYPDSRLESEIYQRFYEEYGRGIDELDMKKPKDVADFHVFLESTGISDRVIETMFLANAQSNYKPNVIFDVTLKNLKKFDEVTKAFDIGGYPPEDRHLVWILTGIDVAVGRNQQRSRSVPDSIIFKSHTGASLTVKALLSNLDRRKLDGDIYVVFNNIGDTIVEVFEASGAKPSAYKELMQYNAYQLKRKGEAPMSVDAIELQILEKLNEYVPDDAQW